MKEFDQHPPSLPCQDPHTLLPDLVCRNFLPLSQFFLAHLPQLLSSPLPSYTQTRSSNFRDNLSTSRQLKYLRRAVNQDYCQGETRVLLEEPGYEPYCRKGNASVVMKNSLFWASQGSIKELLLEETLALGEKDALVRASLGKGEKIMDLHEIIFQLLPQSPDCLLARTPRHLFLIDPFAKQVLQKYPFSAEITSVWSHLLCPNSSQLYLSLFDGTRSSIHTFSPQLAALKLWESGSPEPILAGWNLTRNELLFCTNQTVRVFDVRAKATSTMWSTVPNHSRIYAGLYLDKIGKCNLFALAQTLSINLFDLRKTSSPMFQLPHYNQEAPPSILQIVDPNTQPSPDQCIQRVLEGKENRQVITAHSPYPLGSAYFYQLREDRLEESLSVAETEQRGELGENSLSMVFDAGKIDRYRYPRSLTGQWFGNCLSFMHVDNFEGVVFQNWKLESRWVGKGKQRKEQTVLQRMDCERPVLSSGLQDSNWEWFRFKNLKKMTHQDDDYWSQELQRGDQDLELEEKKLEERYLRFADLGQFYHQVVSQSQGHSGASRAREENQRILEGLQEKKQLQSTLPSLGGAVLAEGETDELGLGEHFLSLEQMIELNSNWDQD